MTYYAVMHMLLCSMKSKSFWLFRALNNKK